MIYLGGDGRFYVGRLIPYKGLSLAIRALAQPQCVGWHLDVIGTGWDRGRCEKLTRRLGIDERVHFLGSLGRDDVLQRLSEVDVMLAPSMFEGSGYAVAEAVASGCPVICLDRGGPAVMVAVGEGVKVPGTANVVVELANGLRDFPPRHEGTNGWSEARLSERLDYMYGLALDVARARAK